MTRHSFTLFDRGVQHVHRWRPACSCGHWTGSNHRRKREAVKQHRHHVNACVRFSYGEPRPVTPSHLLPAELRVLA